MTTKATWRKRIRVACEEAGTYEPFFDLAIDQLDTNLVKNPMLVIMNECDQQALAYWRDLGLTPSGFKKLGNEMVSIKREASFEDLLSKIGI